MKKKRFHYFIRGCRWAPENFGASKGLTKDSRKAIPLTLDERREVGILSLTKGPDAAMDTIQDMSKKIGRSIDKNLEADKQRTRTPPRRPGR